MAQFEIIDEYTYEVCLLPKEKALAFVDYLRSIGINAKAKDAEKIEGKKITVSQTEPQNPAVGDVWISW